MLSTLYLIIKLEKNHRKIRYPELIKIEWVELLGVPFTIRIVEHGVESRNGRDIRVLRFQRLAPKEFDAPYIAFALCKTTGNLISYRNRMLPVLENRLSEDDALVKAKMLLRKISPEYYTGISFLRIETPTRQFINLYGELEDYPIYRVEFTHEDGSYASVGLSMCGQVSEYEIDLLWDSSSMRRKTEMWDHDGWVKARYGLGPELEKPHALARNK